MTQAAARALVRRWYTGPHKGLAFVDHQTVALGRVELGRARRHDALGLLEAGVVEQVVELAEVEIGWVLDSRMYPGCGRVSVWPSMERNAIAETQTSWCRRERTVAHEDASQRRSNQLALEDTVGEVRQVLPRVCSDQRASSSDQRTRLAGEVRLRRSAQSRMMRTHIHRRVLGKCAEEVEQESDDLVRSGRQLGHRRPARKV